MKQMIFRFSLLLILLASGIIFALAQTPLSQIKIAFLDESASSSKFTEQFSQNLQQNNFKLLDQDLARAAANGAKIENPFNLTLDEAKNLAALIDCNFFFIIRSETGRRSSFQKDVYFESYAIVFLISAQTGHLLTWTDKHFEADSPASSEKLLLADAKEIAADFAAKISETTQRERSMRADNLTGAVLIEDLPDEQEEEAADKKFRVPLPYKRLRPEYTSAAARRSIEATVDILAELNERGEVTRTEIVRWAGFELDEAVTNTVRKMQFRPALRDGNPLAIRIVLRYNFRDLQKQ
ncbi:MAG: energy transducer TonB [Pyrinomonadaceae bacterium]